MSDFSFVGRLPASKSMLNRLLVVQSHAPHLAVRGESDCEDVRVMRECLTALGTTSVDLPVASAGTVLRFAALRASRVPGRHRLVGSPRLFARPQTELIKILNQLGVRASLSSDSLELEGEGWHLQGDTLLVPSERSSQFASAVLLNAWGLPFDLYVSLGGRRVSEGYWRMTVRMMQRLGMKLDFWDSDFRVPKLQRVEATEAKAEMDLSSAFVITALAAVSGQATLTEFPEMSEQPDFAFVDILQRMGVRVEFRGGHLHVEKARQLNGVAVNLRSTPDLFPVLAALCACAEGESELFGAPHLIHKESDRLKRLADLLSQLGRQIEVREDGLRLFGPALRFSDQSAPRVTFDCDQDHRLAFAAAVLRAAGAPLAILHPHVVEKSFPEFWQIAGGV